MEKHRERGEFVTFYVVHHYGSSNMDLEYCRNYGSIPIELTGACGVWHLWESHCRGQEGREKAEKTKNSRENILFQMDLDHLERLLRLQICLPQGRTQHFLYPFLRITICRILGLDWIGAWTRYHAPRKPLPEPLAMPNTIAPIGETGTESGTESLRLIVLSNSET
jgi:hypothetical protein